MSPTVFEIGNSSCTIIVGLAVSQIAGMVLSSNPHFAAFVIEHKK